MNHIFVANWKMHLSFNESLACIQDNLPELSSMAEQHTLVVCPSYTAIAPIASLCKKTNILVGAQNVSKHPFGAYTGEVSATSLAEAGATYCIIGHSETRQHEHETNNQIEHKLKELLKNNITPIICIGETKEEYDQQQTLSVLEEQLSANLAAISTIPHSIQELVVAYEPVWAVGTDLIPQTAQLVIIFDWLQKQCTTKTTIACRFIYGGSVSATNAATLLKIKHINGLLIGRSSTNVETLKAITNSV